MPSALSAHWLRHLLPVCLTVASLGGCVRPTAPPPLTPLPTVSSDAGMASIREDGPVGRTTSLGAGGVSYGISNTPSGSNSGASVTAPGATGAGATLDFADTDIRAVAAQILGAILHANYTIDPGVHGTVSLHSSTPISTDQLLPTLEVLLSQVNATLVTDGALYRIVPTSGANSSGIATAPNAAGSQIIPLQYVNADDLVRVLQPFVSQGARIAAAPGGNAILLAGDPTARQALAGLIAAFDVNSLAGQSFALFPVDSGSAKDVATALQQAVDTSGSSSARGQASSNQATHVIAMDRINAVLVTANNASTIAAAERIFDLIRHRQNTTTRSWTVYYLQNGHSNDVAYILQQAFTPDHVTATPTPTATVKSMTDNSQSGSSGGGINGAGGGGLGNGGVGGVGGGSLGGLGASGSGLGSNSGSNSSASANPLLGGLDATSGDSGSSNNEMRIIPDGQNNALLIYGTPQELNTVQATLRKIDIIPLQVRIDAVIAEVQLNDALRYGTQFFFKAGGLNGTLTSVFNATNSFSGYFLAGSDASQVALDMLQAVSTVHVLSSPELMVLDNQPARLEVGDLVPYLTQQAQSTVTSTSDIINSVSYEQTGVILEVTPRVSSDGLVTLDIAQEVSNVNTTASSSSSTTGINSPTFTQRDVQSRVVVQDGQTIGLAGLIQDSVTRSNQGVPFIKDIPVIGALFGQQNNTRTRDELLVLITPHVIHDQRDALDLTQDLREQLPNAAAVPQVLQQLPLSGSDDPTAGLRRRLGSP
ncbi:type II secretion system secretin GspD [Acidisoma cellulosilytica]|uniref:Type II secretion system secretin GspD n=1 Tax=Acidisoma cellulosilyticum TaxID=2802395 RepID=A0A963Z655_9PROT|nr:type II secretion system secretin GspD [Acidisoma cellulosilyticum]MCB8883211.1 type II secretion system secretin GspD [Acidisoma cellulosilyticum]